MAKKLTLVFGVVFLLVGVLGFIPNPIVGADGAWFHADTVHNLVHLISGAIFLYVAVKSPGASAMTLKVFGAVYLLVAILGFVTIGSGEGQLLGLIGINGADNWLHLVLGLVIFGAGFSGGKENSMSQPMM
jgi:hypothetical protein